MWLSRSSLLVKRGLGSGRLRFTRRLCFDMITFLDSLLLIIKVSLQCSFFVFWMNLQWNTIKKEPCLKIYNIIIEFIKRLFRYKNFLDMKTKVQRSPTPRDKKSLCNISFVKILAMVVIIKYSMCNRAFTC